MKRFFTKPVVITILFLMFCGIANAQSLLYYNAFGKGETNWTNYDDQITNARIEGGKYTLTHKQHASSVITPEIAVDYSRNFAIQTVVAHAAGEDRFPVGLAFFGKDGFNEYYFGVAVGQYMVGKCDNGVNSVIAAWTPSSAVATGTAPNKLRIEKLSNTVKFYINDVMVKEVPRLEPFGNKFGFIVQGQQSASFDYLKLAYLTDPNAQIVNVEPVNRAIIETAYHTDFAKDDQNQWILPAQDSLTTAITDGYFKMTRIAKTGYNLSVTSANLKVDMTRDYLIETDAVHYSGSQNFGYGLEFAGEQNKVYHFWISASGYYYIGYSDAKGFNTILTWTPSDAIKKGDLAKNKLGVMHKNAQLSFYINDQLVTSHPEIVFTGYLFGFGVCANQNIGFHYLTFGYLDRAAAPKTTVQNDVTPPEIFITSPEVTRGLKVVQNSDVLHVAGVAKDASGIFSVVVNGIQATVDKIGNFTVEVPMALGDNPLMVVATDMNMNKGSYTFHIVRNNISATAQTTVQQSAAQGKYYALLIGVQDYKDTAIPSLEGPVGDAATLLKTLTNNYTFAPENVITLNNATREQFFNALESLSIKVKPEDNLLIFYAGHGYYDELHLQGYWYPADAVLKRRDTWISNADLIDYVTAIKSKHTLLISDACFSGSIFKTRAIEMAPKDIQELYKLPSRKAMTSGAMKEVPDKSVFMQYLVKRLTENTDQFLPAEQLFASFKAAVINNSPNGQVPQFGEIREAGDEGGDFIFIKKQ